jgi:hypothetical protein
MTGTVLWSYHEEIPSQANEEFAVHSVPLPAQHQWVLAQEEALFWFGYSKGIGPGRDALPNVMERDVGRFLAKIYHTQGPETFTRWCVAAFAPRTGACPLITYLRGAGYPPGGLDTEAFSKWWGGVQTQLEDLVFGWE